MPFVRKYSMLLLALLFLSSAAFGDVDEDKDKRRKNRDMAALMAKSQGLVADCNLGSASAELDVNNVRARLYNNGGLFWIGGSPIYEVPKGSGSQAIFASGIWLGGLADGDLRMAAATYSDWEFWPGPLDASGQPPADCAPFDRMFRVSREDIRNYQATGVASADMNDWPWQLGAPVADGDGNPDNYNLAGGDLPGILGDQSIWWVMNDAGNLHLTTETPPMGVEIQALAFSFNQAGALGNTTFYKYKLIYKGTETLTDVYLGLWSDPDLGAAGDDYVGSDSALGIGFVMNGDNFDEGSTGYGDRPPALGYDFFQGPLVDNDGLDNNRDGVVDEEGERVAMAKFVYYNNDSSVQGNPFIAQDYYNYLQGLWIDGVPITFGGSGRGFSEDPTNYMYPADPPNFWSEDNTDGTGTRNPPDDRRFLQSAGPFTMNPGDEQEIVFGIVWAQAGDRIGSVAWLKQEDAKAQTAFDLDFNVPPPPDPPRVTVTEVDNGIILNWDYTSLDNNYLDKYDEPSINLVVQDPEDDTYTFEGYIVYQYTDANDQTGQIIAVYDRANNLVTNVTERVLDPATGALNTVLLVPGTDSGLKKSHFIENLTNYTTYFFGVQAYAYNAFSNPQWFPSPITRVVVNPSKITASNGGTVLNVTPNTVLETIRTAGVGGGSAKDAAGAQGVNGVIVDPSKVTGDNYAVEVVSINEDGDLSYNLRNKTQGTLIFDAQSTYSNSGLTAPFSTGAFNVDGVSFTVTGPAPAPLILDGSLMYVEEVGPGGADPCGAGAVSTFGCSLVGGNFLYPSFNGTGQYLMYHVGPGPEEEGHLDLAAPRDFEIRFTAEGGYATYPFGSDDDVDNHIKVPFEVWDIGITGTGTTENPNDPADDVRLIPNLFSDGDSDGVFEFQQGWPDNALFSRPHTDRIYAYYPVEGSTYDDWEALVKPSVDAGGGIWNDPAGAQWGLIDFSFRPIQRVVFIDNQTDDDANFIGSVNDLVGAVVRFYTTKPLLDGDVYEINTAGLSVETGNTATREEALDLIAVVPNPYLGASDYEISRVVDVARLTNLPRRATIRIFTLNGTLIRTLEKNSTARFLNWDLNTEEGLPIASGMYLIHVEAKDDAGATFGERVLKFAVVKKRIQLNEL